MKKIKVTFTFKKIGRIAKEELAYKLLFFGMLISFLGSLNPWFMWSIGALYPILSLVFLIPALLLSNASSQSLFTERKYIPTFIIYLITSFYITIVSGYNINGQIVNLIHASTFFCLYTINIYHSQRICDNISKFMGGILAVSIGAFFLHIIGFPFPSRNVSFGDYSYTNYYFFMIDDRSILALIPRFSSYFLEPGHLGTATVMLLTTQIGKWKTWYNKVLLTATLISFSLAAYVLLVVLICLDFWIQRKKFIGKLIGIIIFIAAIVTGSFYYNNGDNLLHDLIVIRMEINDDGELAGNNRTTEDFQRQFSSFMSSDDIFTGRGNEEIPTGNSGYQVFIYRYGLIGTILIIILYIGSYYHGENKRAIISAIIIAFLAFIVRGYPLWDSNFIPLFVLANCQPIRLSEIPAVDNDEDRTEGTEDITQQ